MTSILWILLLFMAYIEAILNYRAYLYFVLLQMTRESIIIDRNNNDQNEREKAKLPENDYLTNKILFPPNFQELNNMDNERSGSTHLPKENNMETHRLSQEEERYMNAVVSGILREEKLPSRLNTNISVNSHSQTLMKEADVEYHMGRLNNLIGLSEVKKFVSELKDFVEIENMRRAAGQKQTKPTLHMVFTGNPGTGKTTVARIVADILKSLGVVSKGQLIEVTREDLVEGYIGQTALKTKKVIEQATGGVLFIDEAYSLSRGGEQDFGKEAIDTLVKAMDEKREDLVVIVAGYTKEMQEFMKENSGLSSRFPLDVEFKDYTPGELLQILKKSLNEKKFSIAQDTEKDLQRFLEQNTIAGRNDSGNGRLVRNLVDQAIRKQSSRLKKEGSFSKEKLMELQLSDFGLERNQDFQLEDQLSAIVGNSAIKEKIRMMEAQFKINRTRESKGLATETLGYHMVFQGNPGTGKTTIARIMASLMKELGIVKKGHLVEVTREDLVAGYVGQTALKTKAVIDQALGGILFIDEAYALTSGGADDFGQEAINTLVKAMEEHRNELVVILAGYTGEMEQFFNSNSGLRSRFSNIFEFEDYSPDELMEIFKKMVNTRGYRLDIESKVHAMLYFHRLKKEPSQGNGRLVRNVLDQAIQNQALRLTKVPQENLTVQDLELLIFDDFRFLNEAI